MPDGEDCPFKAGLPQVCQTVLRVGCTLHMSVLEWMGVGGWVGGMGVGGTMTTQF